MEKLSVDFSDVKKTLDDLIKKQKDCAMSELIMHRKIKKIIYWAAKTYTTKENAEKISSAAMDVLIAKGVRIDT